jgi:hypothetical protein
MIPVSPPCPKRSKLHCLYAGLLVAACVVVLIAWRTWVLEGGIDELYTSSEKPLPSDGRPAFVVSKRQLSVFQLSRDANPLMRLRAFFDLARRRVTRPTPGIALFGPRQTTLETVRGLATECAFLTGDRYLVGREIAEETVLFGHTNSLKGNQWLTKKRS